MTDGVPAVLLAAGASRRLGRAKQLETLEGEPLVRRAARAALGAGCEPVVVVLGAEAEAVAAALDGLALTLVRNEAWEEGMASSLGAGLAALGDAAPEARGALLLLADQPAVDAALLRRLLARFEESGARRIVACAYGGGRGAPAVFPRTLFSELAALRGDRGAKPVLEAHRAEVLEVSFPEGELDVDTPADLARARGARKASSAEPLVPPNEPSIRFAGRDEAPRVAALYRETGYEGGLLPSDRLVIAEHPGRVVGAYRLAREHGALVLRGLRVHPSVRRRRIGTRLLGALRELDEDCYCVAHTHLEGFYAAAGFAPLGDEAAPRFLRERAADYRGRGLRVLVMRRSPSAMPGRRVPYDPTIYRGSAPYYARGRPPYSARLVPALREELGLDGTGRLLDVGGGPGVLLRELASCVAEAVGLDPDAEMLAEGARLAAEAGIANARWVRGLAEEIPALGLGAFTLVSFGQSFQWTERERVAEAVYDQLEPGGSLVLVAPVREGRPVPEGPGPPPIPHEAIRTIVDAYLGPRRRAGAGFVAFPPDRYEDALARTRFGRPRSLFLPGPADVVRDADGVLAGYFSMSYCAPHLFGDRLASFEADVRAELGRSSSSGLFWDWPGDTEVLLATKPRGG